MSETTLDLTVPDPLILFLVLNIVFLIDGSHGSLLWSRCGQTFWVRGWARPAPDAYISNINIKKALQS